MSSQTIELNPEKTELDAKLFDMLCELWLGSCIGRVKPYTYERYAEKLDYVRRWWAEVGPTHNWVMGEDTLLGFERWLCGQTSRFGKPLAYHTRKDALRRLRQVFTWAWTKGYIKRDFTDWVPAPSGSAPLRKAPPLDSLRRLIEACDQSAFPLRNRAIIAIMLGTGVRRTECAGIDVDDVQLYADGTGTITVKAKEVKGREIHQRVVAFDASTGSYIRDHLDALAKDDIISGPLFLSKRYDQYRLTSIGLYKVAKEIIIKAGLEKQIQGPHDLRRLFATYYSRSHRGEGYGHLLSKQMGHSDYRMTAHYSLQDVDDIRESIVSVFALLAEEDRLRGQSTDDSLTTDR